MKTHRFKFKTLLFVTTAFVVCCLSAFAAQSTNPPVLEFPHSTFVIPANQREGRDPFFPNSIRPYTIEPTAQTSHADISTMKIGGISRSGDSFVAIINNVAFGVGDVADVKVGGGKISVRCLEINSKSVVIEVSGQKLTLTWAGE